MGWISGSWWGAVEHDVYTAIHASASACPCDKPSVPLTKPSHYILSRSILSRTIPARQLNPRTAHHHKYATLVPNGQDPLWSLCPRGDYWKKNVVYYNISSPDKDSKNCYGVVLQVVPLP